MMLKAEDMRAQAESCEQLALKVHQGIASQLLAAARHWRQLADQMEFLEREPVYRVIRRQTCAIALNGQATFSGGTFQCIGRIEARRVS
jgi:hypothetical protein